MVYKVICNSDNRMGKIFKMIENEINGFSSIKFVSIIFDCVFQREGLALFHISCVI